MFGLGKIISHARCGLVIDVGSTNVAAAIVVSEVGAFQPTVVWTHVVACPLSAEFHLYHQVKQVATAITKLTTVIETKGTRALARHHPRLRLTDTLVSISAPWSYTLPTPVRYQTSRPCMLTKNQLKMLHDAATEHATATSKTTDLFAELGLEIIAGETTYLSANDYTTKNFVGHTIHDLIFKRDLTVADKSLVVATRQLQTSIAPNTNLVIRSFMQNLHQPVVSHTVPEQVYGIMDMNDEATEVGVASDKQLRVVYNHELGINELARQLARLSNQPLTSAYALLLECRDGQPYHLSPSRRQTWEQLLATYLNRQGELITRCARVTEPPRHFIVYGNGPTRDLVVRLTRQVVNQIVPGATVSLASDKSLKLRVSDEPRLAISLTAFHADTQTLADTANA